MAIKVVSFLAFDTNKSAAFFEWGITFSIRVYITIFSAVVTIVISFNTEIVFIKVVSAETSDTNSFVVITFAIQVDNTDSVAVPDWNLAANTLLRFSISWETGLTLSSLFIPSGTCNTNFDTLFSFVIVVIVFTAFKTISFWIELLTVWIFAHKNCWVSSCSCTYSDTGYQSDTQEERDPLFSSSYIHLDFI